MFSCRKNGFFLFIYVLDEKKSSAHTTFRYIENLRKCQFWKFYSWVVHENNVNSYLIVNNIK